MPKKDNRDIPISKEQLKEIREDINRNNPELAIKAQTDINARRELARYVRKNYATYIHQDQAITEYIVKEVVGIGFLEDVLLIDGITDIGWNGDFLTVETNQDKVSLTKQDLGGTDVVNENYIEQIISRFLVADQKELNEKNAIIDLIKDNLRLSIVDRSLSPTGRTFSIRVTHSALSLNQDNFIVFAPQFVLDFIHTMMLTGATCTISGKTGTGKTELQKLMISFTNPKDRIIMIGDVDETHLKDLFPDKDVFSYVTNPDHPITELVKMSLRQNPDWVHIAEVRGGEAFEMLQGVLTGNYMITTLHTVDTYSVPKRLSNMITNVYSNANEDSIISDVLTYFDFGFHIEKLDIYDEDTGQSKRIRYLAEIREFADNDTRGTLIFKQQFKNGQFFVTTNDLSEGFKDRMAKKFLAFKMPKYTNQVRKDMDSTPEGQLLLKVRQKMANQGQENGREVHTNIEDYTKQTVNDLYQQKQHVTRMDLSDREVSDLYVNPNEKVNYTNPDHVDPDQPSLYSDGQNHGEQYTEKTKEHKASKGQSLKDRILNTKK